METLVGAAQTLSPVEVLVVDDHDLVRLGIKSLMQSCARAQQMQIRWHDAATLAQALEIYAQRQGRIQMVLLDLQLSDAHGLCGLESFKQRFPNAPVVVLSGQGDAALMRRALEAGALAYLRKSDSMQPVVDFVCSLTAGPPAPPALEEGADQAEGMDGKGLRTVHAPNGARVELSARQSQILDALLSGMSNREIAEHLHLSDGTVRNHISDLLLSFCVRSRAQLILLLR